MKNKKQKIKQLQEDLKLGNISQNQYNEAYYQLTSIDEIKIENTNKIIFG